MPVPAESLGTELDARNRATNYLQQAMEERERQDREEQTRQSADFQQLLWLKNLDHAHALEVRSSEHRHALEMEEKRQRAAIEIRELEQSSNPKAVSSNATSTGSWIPKALLTVCTIVLPIVIPMLVEMVMGKRSRIRRAYRFGRVRKRRKPVRSKKRRRKSWTN